MEKHGKVRNLVFFQFLDFLLRGASRSFAELRGGMFFPVFLEKWLHGASRSFAEVRGGCKKIEIQEKSKNEKKH
jgi:hypothetical protein